MMNLEDHISYQRHPPIQIVIFRKIRHSQFMFRVSCTHARRRLQPIAIRLSSLKYVMWYFLRKKTTKPLFIKVRSVVYKNTRPLPFPLLYRIFLELGNKGEGGEMRLATKGFSTDEIFVYLYDIQIITTFNLTAMDSSLRRSRSKTPLC